MRKILLPLLSAIPMFMSAQVNLKTLKKESHKALVYPVTTAIAEKYINTDSINVDAFLSATPFAIFPKDSIDEAMLPTGHYVIITAEDNMVKANVTGVSNLLVYAVNNQHSLQLLVRNKTGSFINNAKVWVNNKTAPFDSTYQAYMVKQKYPDEAEVKIYTPGDTVFVSLFSDEDEYKSILQQRWINFKKTCFGRIITWLPNNVSYIFKWRRYYRYNYRGRIGSGTMLFNQPKYKLTDTVKFKAYIYKKMRRYNKQLYTYLQYYKNGALQKQLLTVLKPSSPGSYMYQFPLSDTLANNNNYTILLQTKKRKTVFYQNFKAEDYLLNEVATYKLRTSKDFYYSGDTIHVYASANDANGLSLLDGSAELTLVPGEIKQFYKDTMYIPDTLFRIKKSLAVQGETEFLIPVNTLPPAKLNIQASLIFRNGNNEQHEETIDFSYHPFDTTLAAKVIGDSIYAGYSINGNTIPAKARMIVSGGINETQYIQLPAKFKVDPLAEKYTFYLIKGNSIADSAAVTVDNYYTLSFNRISTGDSLGFALYNPMKIPVTFSVFDGNKVKGAGKSNSEQIKWLVPAQHKNSMYTVKWQYMWHNEEKYGQQNIELLYKIMNIHLSGSASVFPGQRDTINVTVTDYNKKPVSGANLTAVSYNNQFQKDIHVTDPPYLQRYKLKPLLLHNKFETDDGYILEKYPLGNHKGWLKILGLDTMPYYKMLFPAGGFLDIPTHVADYLPQVAVHIVQNGRRLPVYLLYLNNNMVYYNGVTDSLPYAFATYPGYAKITVRLYDMQFETDSIYLQAFYKHDIVFDIDSLNANNILTKMPIHFTRQEIKRLESKIWRLDNNYVTNNSYVWQNQSVVHIQQNHKHIIGPFDAFDSLHFFVPGNFDTHFKFEPGYEYNVAKNLVRLEKKPLFVLDDSAWLPKINSPNWLLGDTIADPPAISYKAAIIKPMPYIRQTDNLIFSGSVTGSIYYTIPAGIHLQNAVLYRSEDDSLKMVLAAPGHHIYNIQPGTYTILLVNSKFETAVITNIAVSAGATFCINTGGAEYRNGNKVIEQLINESMKPMPVLQGAQKKAERPVLQPEDLLPGYKTGAAFITGKIVDAKGKLPVAFATVTIKGTKRATATNAYGEFTLSGLKGGSYTLVISGIGYETAEVLKQAGSAPSEATISLKPAIASLSEVVVTGYGRQRKLDVTGAVAVVKEADLFSSDSLSGKAAGVQVSAENGAPGNTIQIILRGISSSTIDNSPLFIVDGIAYDTLPANISPDFIESISVLKGAETAIYGARAAGGVIVITTKTKTLRNQFRDYAFWIPQVLTDKNGNAQFTVTYPDNVTGWQTYVLGMDKHRRIGKATTFVRSYKPVMAQLSTPQFLLQGDTAQVMGKAYNYTQSSYNISSTFNINHVAVMHGNTVLQPNASSVHGYIVAAPVADTVTTAYTLQTTTGFKDGEERKIPVFKPGTEETNGCFWVLRADTSFIYKPQLEGPVNIYVQNNALDFFLQEIELLKKYPYYCMEQTSSKLKGLLMEKRINEALHKPFTDDKTIDLLVDKIRKNQLYDGGWPWWPGGSADIYITNYVIQALVGLRQNPLVETSIRNGLLYLQNQLPTLDGDKLLSTLLTMCKAKHQLNYGPWLKKLTFDSLTILQQWQYVIIQQALGMPHTAELDSLLNRGVPGMLGSLHWGDYNYRWYSDANAATILAFEAMQNEKGYDKELNDIMQYFLQQRADGYWPNTVTSASVLYALVPYVLAQNSSFNRPAEIRVAGDTAFTIQRFPFAGKISNKSGALNIYKTGGGLTYFTVYQHWFNKDPLAVTGNFDITTYFEKDGRKISYLNAGTKVTLVANINVLKEAEYVMIEIPIPAGCTYAMHNQDDWAVHKEFLKNKLVLFTNYLPQGINRFTVELEVRYSGTYTLNPASASLMYFPSFFGRGDMKKVLIQ